MIVLTGDMVRGRSDWGAEFLERGLMPHPTVTKKIELVVAADTDLLSGETKKARRYGIPIVNDNGWREVLKGKD